MSRKTSRREFAAGIAVAAGALTLPALAEAQQQPSSNEALTATAQAMTDIIRARYGKHLGDEQLKRVQQKIRGNLLGAEVLKRARLENGDEPSFVFGVD